MPLARTTLYLALVAAWFWISMLFTHEIGHVAAAKLTGAKIAYLNLYPGQIPTTLFNGGASPAAVLWAGVLSGWLAPVLVAGGLHRVQRSRSLLWCWVGFCWAAGGLYLAFGGLEALTDTTHLVRTGVSLGLLVVMGCGFGIAGYVVFRRNLVAVLRDLEAKPPSAPRLLLVCIAFAVWVAIQWLIACQLVANLD